MRINQIMLVLSLSIFSACSNHTAHIPILGTRTAITREIKGKKVTDTLYHTIPPFNMLGQDSVKISNATLKGKIYVADFFFTSCPSICPVMQKNMLKLYKQYKDERDFAFLSYSI